MNETEPSPPKSTRRDAGKNKDLNQENQPAISGFNQFWAELTQASRDEEQRLEKILDFLAPVKKPLAKTFHKISPLFIQNRKLFWPLFLLLIMVLLPWISQASISSQTEAELKAYAEPLDPIKTGQMALNFNQYLPPELYADPDKVVLDKMTENETFTLAQQLSLNAGANAEGAPDRQAPTYELQNGETITQVANKFDLHVGTILQANNLKAEDLKKIKPGTVLKIPSSDTDTSDTWLVAINRAEAEARAKAQAEADAKKKKAASARVARATADDDDNSIATTITRRGGSYGSVKVIGSYPGQCLPWARERSGVQVRGYAGDVRTTQSEPKVGGLAFDRFFGHVSVVVGVSNDTITVQEANFIRGKITERVVSKAAIRGYVY